MKQNNKLQAHASEYVLKKVLNQFDITDNAISIGAPAEQCICLEKSGDKFCVYVVERGLKFQESQHQTEYAAHLEILHQLASSKGEYHKMRSTYRRLLKQHERQLKLLEEVFSIKLSVPTLYLPDINVGDNVRIHIKPTTVSQNVSQKFEGTVISKKDDSGLVVRGSYDGTAFKRNLTLHSSDILKIEIIGKEKIRHTKLFLSHRHGKNTDAKKEEV